jgi:tetratricopeptide (TPR) repeat protein
VTGLSKRLGPEDPLTLKAMFHLARTYLHTGEEKKCHALLLWVLRLQKRFFGKNHVDTLMTRNELGMLLCASKRHLTAALRIVENVLDARRRILGEEHAYTLWSINDLSKVYTELGRVDEAVNMLEEIIPVVTRTLGEHHVGMSMTKGNLSRAYFLLERWDDAMGCLLPGLQKLPPNHPDWINAMYGRSHILFKQGKLAEAEEECVDLLYRIKSKKILPLNHPRTISIADLLLDIYGSQGRNDMIMIVKNKIPSAGLTKSEERFDPYGIRKGSLQPPQPQIPEPSSSNEQSKRDSHQCIPRDRQILLSKSLEQGPKPNLIARRTF